MKDDKSMKTDNTKRCTKEKVDIDASARRCDERLKREKTKRCVKIFKRDERNGVTKYLHATNETVCH